MMHSNCSCQTNCTSIAVITSIAIGVVAAILRFTAIITVTPIFSWVLLGIAIGYLGITLLSSAFIFPDRKNCCTNLGTFLTGILGTILTSVILLSVTFAATSVLGAIITGFLLFFFSLLIISATCLIGCRYDCD